MDICNSRIYLQTVGILLHLYSITCLLVAVNVNLNLLAEANGPCMEPKILFKL